MSRRTYRSNPFASTPIRKGCFFYDTVFRKLTPSRDFNARAIAQIAHERNNCARLPEIHVSFVYFYPPTPGRFFAKPELISDLRNEVAVRVEHPNYFRILTYNSQCCFTRLPNIRVCLLHFLLDLNNE